MNEHPHDRDFEDFLRRKRPLFRGGDDGPLEPPAELDRIVLRQAREAIQEDPPQRLYHTPRWGAPLAIAATLVLGLTFVFKAGMTTTEVRPQVAVETIAQREAAPPSPPPAPAPDRAPAGSVTPATAPALASSAAAPDASLAAASPPAARTPAFVSEEEARRHEAPPVSPPAGRTVTTAGAVVADAAAAPAWRRDSRAWLAEIERLRASGDVARADAEMAEYNRQHRALAISPDR